MAPTNIRSMVVVHLIAVFAGITVPGSLVINHAQHVGANRGIMHIRHYGTLEPELGNQKGKGGPGRVDIVIREYKGSF
jgi:hypothetical protein